MNVLDRSFIARTAQALNTDESHIEKDWHVVRALGVITSVDVAGVTPVLSGGTSLAAAWMLISRFSEDIDPSIVRHLHDLAALSASAAESSVFGPLAREILERDAKRTKDPDAAGLALLRAMLPRITADPLWRTEYEQFVQAVSFGSDADRISFDRAIAACEQLVEQILKEGG